jgi:hypothetical protein
VARHTCIDITLQFQDTKDKENLKVSQRGKNKTLFPKGIIIIVATGFPNNNNEENNFNAMKEHT